MNRRTKRDSTVILTVLEELLKHYNCNGCHKGFTISESDIEPSKCPNCGKVVKDIECTK